MIVWCFLLAGACTQLDASRPGATPEPAQAAHYTWSSFFNDGCGATMAVHLVDETAGTLEYECPGGEIKSQHLKGRPGKGDTRMLAAEPLADAELYGLSNSKCQATVVVLGSAHASIQYRCALVVLTVGYRVAERRPSEEQIHCRLKPERALLAYSDGTQAFEVDRDTFIPTGPFKPFQAAPAPEHSL